MVQTLIWRIVCNKVFGGGYGYSFVGKQWAKSNRKHKSDNKENDLPKTVPLSPCYFSVDETPMTQDDKTQISADCSYWTQIDKKLQKWNKVLMKRREVQQPELVTRRQSCLNLDVLSSCLPTALLQLYGKTQKTCESLGWMFVQCCTSHTQLRVVSKEQGAVTLSVGGYGAVSN